MEDNVEIKNKELVDAIRNMIINETDENRNTMLDEVMKATFITPITYVDANGAVVDKATDDEEQFILNLISNDNIGKTMFPVFTDMDEFNKAKGQKFENYITTNVKTYIDIFKNPDMAGKIDGMVINPFGMSMMLNTQFFEVAAQRIGESGMTAKKFDTDTKFSFAIPDEKPTDMLAAIAEYLKFREDVDKAYYVLMAVNDEQPKPFLAVDYKGDNPNELFNGIGKIITPYLKGSEIGMSTCDNEMITNAMANIEAFYQKA